MMTAALHSLIEAIHAAGTRAVLVSAGAGTQALADLLAVGGASRTVIEGLVPYSQASFTDFLGQAPEHFVAASTARLLAGRAYTRARWLEPASPRVVGLACTGAIASDRPKKGEHRAHIAVWQPEQVVTYNLRLAKGARDRAGEEALVSRVLINALAAAGQVGQQLPLDLLTEDELTVETVAFAPLAEQLQRGEINYWGLHADGSIRGQDVPPRVILSGSFNPLHEGHLGMARVAGDMVGEPVVFELAAANVDKPPLPVETILARIAQFAGRYAVLVSRAPTYLQKARLYPDTTFVVGYDTAVRIFDPRYYDNSPDQMAAALREIRTRGCSFLVAGRADNAGHFHGLADMAIPAAYADLFRAIPPEQFRYDISSTHLRAAGLRGSR